MAKGDDALMRKKNKERRKKMNKKNDSSTVSARIASIIASKKRRASGKRRMCQGMCFSLPTPDDPFNDRHGKMDFSKRERKKPVKKNTRKGSLGRENAKATELEVDDKKMMTPGNDQKSLVSFLGNGKEIQLKRKDSEPLCENIDRPSKFLMLCLNEIENAMRTNGTYNDNNEKPLFLNSWGVEFWRCYLSGKDVLETSEASSTPEQIAWIFSMAADAMARNEKEGLSVGSPFLVFLVPSQEKAAKVRSVCKPLKSLGIHTVSLHPGASLDHQINGLRSCEPEFLVSTPERLLEIVSLKAMDISGVSMLVIDELDSLCRDGRPDAVKSIKQIISGKHQTVVFSDCRNCASVPTVQSLLSGSINRVAVKDSVASQSACIIQSVNVCASDEEKLLKCAEALDSAYGGKLQSKSSKVLYVVKKDGSFQELRATLKIKDYSISSNEHSNISEVKKSGKPVAHMIDIEQTSSINLAEYEVVILPDFVPSIENYVQILGRMARYSVNGILQSFLTKEDSWHAEQLIGVLEECGQAVPETLKKLPSS